MVTYALNPCFRFLHVPSLGIPSLTILVYPARVEACSSLAARIRRPGLPPGSETARRWVQREHQKYCCTRCRGCHNMKRVQTHTMTIYTEATINQKIASQLALVPVSWGVWHCVALHFQNAAQRSARLPGRPSLRPIGGHVTIYLCLGGNSRDMCLQCLHCKQNCWPDHCCSYYQCRAWGRDWRKICSGECLFDPVSPFKHCCALLK